MCFIQDNIFLWREDKISKFIILGGFGQIHEMAKAGGACEAFYTDIVTPLPHRPPLPRKGEGQPPVKKNCALLQRNDVYAAL